MIASNSVKKERKSNGTTRKIGSVLCTRTREKNKVQTQRQKTWKGSKRSKDSLAEKGFQKCQFFCCGNFETQHGCCCRFRFEMPPVCDVSFLLFFAFSQTLALNLCVQLWVLEVFLHLFSAFVLILFFFFRFAQS